MRRRLAMAITLLLLAGSAPDLEAGGRSGGRSGGGHGGSHHGSSHRHHFHGRGTVILGVGPWWGGWWGGWPGWYYPYYPYPYYGYAPRTVVTEPPVYIERQIQTEPPPLGYWYYCESAGGYYPDVQSCPEPWVKVPPTSP